MLKMIVPTVLLAYLLISPTYSKEQKVCPVQKPCTCQSSNDEYRVDCHGKGLREVPVFQSTTGTNNITVDVDVLDLRDNPIDRLDIDVFAGIKPKKILLDGTKLTVKGISIYAFSDVADTVQTLSLTNMRTLTDIPTAAFSALTELTELHITVNVMSAIPHFAFLGLSKLKSLTIFGRKLMSIQDRAFKDVEKSLRYLSLGLSTYDFVDFPLAVRNLVNLEVLNLARNNLRYLPGNAFTGMKRLKSINLFENRLNKEDSFHIDTFKPIEDTMESLVLGFNKLSTIPTEPFQFLRKLKTLDLTGNELYWYKTSKAEFKHFDSLTKLTLGDVEKMTLTETSFEGIDDTLEFLLVRRAGLRAIPREALRPLNALKYLYLDYNKIETLPTYAFMGVSVTYINMAYNNISLVDPKAFRGMTNKGRLGVVLSTNNIRNVTFLSTPCTFESVDLLENPINCDCELLNVSSRWFGGGPKVRGKCHTPQVLAGVSIDEASQPPYNQCGEMDRSFHCPYMTANAISFVVNYFVITAGLAQLYLFVLY